MNIQSLFAIQQKLDQKILETHQLHEQDLVPAKILALQVELGELANETRCFKFWSLKSASSKEVILEEYVDILHFALSIGLDKGYDQQLPLESVEDHGFSSQIEAFSQVYASTVRFAQEESYGNYKDVFQGLIQLGALLGFSQQEIEEAYLEKNRINHTRQEEGY